ncbi:MAG: hypoxanthine phosphoribosyltransferase [Candidatus Zixiibacteriota bacterium]
MITSEQIDRRIVELAGSVREDYRDKNPVLLGTLKGSFVFLAALALKLDIDIQLDFISARSYGNSYISSGTVDLYKNLTIDIRGRHVLVVEDIVDSGHTLRILLEDFELAKPRSVNVITLLNKPANRKVVVPVKYVGFDIDNEFVVGYGLDYSENYRNLPYIAVLNRDEVRPQN